MVGKAVMDQAAVAAAAPSALAAWRVRRARSAALEGQG